MSKRWLCLIDGQKIGPVAFSRLQQLAEAGRLRPGDYVRREDQEQWSSASEIPELIPAPVVTPEVSEKTTVPEAVPEKRRHSGPLPVAKALSDEVTVSIPTVALRRGTPLGKAVATPPPPVSTSESSPLFITPEAKAGTTGDASSRVPGRKRKSNAMPLILGGGAIAGVLALILVLVLSGVIDITGSSSEVANATPARPTKPGEEGEEGAAIAEGEESNPDETENEGAPKPADKVAKKADTKHPLLKTVERFNDITKGSPKLRGSGIKVGVSGLWLSASEAGTPTAAGETPKYLVVKVKIDNPAGAAPMDYKGWGNEAVLFDSDDKPIQPLPASKTPDQVAKQQIEPGASFVDTLVFPLESVEFESLRLALPHETIGVKGAKSFGLELPRHALGRGLDTQVAASADPAVSARRTPSESEEEIVETSPPVKPAPAPMPQKPADKPMDVVDEISQTLEERGKKLDKMDKEKAK